MLSGIAFASWVVRIPDIRAHLGLSEGALGLVLLAVACGGLAAMPVSGALVGRYGSRGVARGAALALAVAVALPPRLPNVVVLAGALALLGGATSVLSVALNTQAAALERRMRRPIMAGLHALYSVGGLLGAALGGVAAGAGISASAHLAGAALLVAGVTLLIAPSLLGRTVEGGLRGAALVRPDRSLALMGLVAFCVLFGEGAVADWSAVYLRDVLSAGPAMAAAAYAAYSLMMAAGRFVGDALTLRIGPASLVRLGAATATVGMLLALTGGTAWVAVTGFAAVGAGLSTIYPTVLAAAGRVRGAPPAGSIAMVSSMGYIGLLAGPPLIGFIAEATSLQIGFATVGLATTLIVGLAGVVPEGEGVRGSTTVAVPV
jgi:MFS family permease